MLFPYRTALTFVDEEADCCHCYDLLKYQLASDPKNIGQTNYIKFEGLIN
jgi:hypothetical protein